jgi:murein DD-endopeptidase MepM/ murein hydrolase activator NlpD
MPIVRPVPGEIISPFGVARDGGARSHEGVDLRATTGTPILAATAGRVFKAGQISTNAGLGVEIDNGAGIVTKYFHMSSVQASVGQNVSAGQQIGLVGQTGNAQTTGPHLHFEIWLNGSAVDPAPYLQGASIGAGGGASGGAGPVLAFFFFLLLLRRL